MRSLLALRRAVDRHPFASDAALALAVTAIVQFDVLSDDGYLSASNWVYVPTTLLMTLPLAWRRRAPLLVVVVVMGAFAAQSFILDPTPTPDVEIVPALIAIYSVAAHGERWAAFAGGGFSLAAGLVWLGLNDFLLPTV